MGLNRWLAVLFATVVAAGVGAVIIPGSLARPWPIIDPRLAAPYGFPFNQRGPALLTPLLVDVAGAVVLMIWLGLYFWLTGEPTKIRYRPQRRKIRPPG